MKRILGMSMSKSVVVLAVLAALVFVAAACGDAVSESEVLGGGAVTSTTAVRETVPASGTGWIDGEPEWLGEDLEVDAAAPASERGTEDEAMASGDGLAISESTAPSSAEIVTAGLSGGSIDDNEDFAGYLAYRERVEQLGIPVREVAVSGRIVAAVVGSTGLPVSGAAVSFAQGDVSLTLRTTADGTVRFYPPTSEPVQIVSGGVSTETLPGTEVELLVDTPGGATVPLPLDIVFLLDATGSMGDEIDQLKATISEVAKRIGELPTQPDVRFGMTLYRDLDDSFVTSTFDLTAEVAAFDSALAAVVADGGGDYPEALDEGLSAALSEPTWRDPATAIQLVFLVADAPPQVTRNVQAPYSDSMRAAAERGIKIFPVSSSGTDDQTEYIFRQFAQYTGGRYVFLTYGAAGRATGEASDISEVDYEELALNDLIVRLVAEELADLTGDGSIVPKPTTTSIPNPNEN
jgi:von Willebrand factor type A domain